MVMGYVEISSDGHLRSKVPLILSKIVLKLEFIVANPSHLKRTAFYDIRYDSLHIFLQYYFTLSHSSGHLSKAH
jgi:hypothetical protein